MHAHPLRLPPPVGPNHPPISVAAIQLPVLPQETFIQQRHEALTSWRPGYMTIF